MPERVTREERMVSLAIEKARLAKEELSAKKRMNIEPTQVKEVDTSVEEVKIKRPKVQDASKITNQTQKKEGYGLAGESLKKADRVAEMEDALERGQRKDKASRYNKMENQMQQIRGMLDRLPKNNLERLLKDNLEDSGLNITSSELLKTLSVAEAILADMTQGLYD